MVTSRPSRSLGIPLCFLMVVTHATAQNSRAVSAASYIDRGNGWYAKGYLDKAIEDYNLALEFDPGSALAYFNRGCARQDKGNLDAAIADYDQAIGLNPRLTDAYTNRGNAQELKQDWEG